MAAAAAAGQVDADTFRRLYPDDYLRKFVEQGLRPDGRPLAAARPTSIGLGAVSTADASALVKVGSTTALAGVKCEVVPALPEAPDAGRLAVQVEMAPLCSATARPGRPSEAAQVLTEQLGALLSSVVDARQLCIDAGKAAWAVYVDIYVLDADGSLHDACLLAALAALSSLRLRAVSIDESGRVQTGAAAQQQQQGEQLAGQQERQLALSCLPVSSTCGLYRGRLLADPTAEEEPLLEAQVTAVLDESGAVLGFSAGGTAAVSQAVVVQCLEAAKMRGKEVRAMLQQALQQAGLAADAAAP
ncbi:hypothetical protein COHA_005279 [Chlorella ohadii]|uniref:Ribosomal RNA-processing protein 43 n=1 Tax=Chlorella ohadii TaxID=2649997 RepID=A0AAD5DRP1_9CHLO|nr:hypothetical protein COHA_005279 [Chlorella ohadii]